MNESPAKDDRRESQAEREAWQQFQAYQRAKARGEFADQPEPKRVAAADRPADVTIQGVITIVLALVFPLAGIIAGIIFGRQARRIEEETGVRPEGYALIQAGLIVCLVVLLIWIITLLSGPASFGGSDVTDTMEAVRREVEGTRSFR